MKYEVTSYNFFKVVGGGADFVKNNTVYHLSAEMLNCMINQYKMMGFMVVCDNDTFISVAKATNEIEVFSAQNN